MKKSGLTGIIIVIVLILGAVVYAVTKSADDEKPAVSNTTSQTQSETKPAEDSENTEAMNAAEANDGAAAVAGITYSDGGFSPASITVKEGDVIEVKNTSDRSVQFESDPHPEHTTNTQLNIHEVAAGASRKFTISNTGTWGYHNHLNADESGEIIVQ